MATKLQYEELNNQTLIETLQPMDFGDLIRVADCSPRFRQLAAKWIVEKFQLHHKQITIDLFENGPISSQTQNIFTIQHHDFVLKTLRLYGYLITKLTIHGYNLTYEQITQIAHHIDRYSLESLTQLNLHHATDMLLQFTDPFTKLVNLRIAEIELDDSLQLNILFPALERLDVTIDNPGNLSSIVHHYPHLQHFGLNEIDWQREFHFVDRFVKANPQIRSFASDNLLSFDSVELLTINWPQLEWLSLTDHMMDLPFYEPGVIVWFDSVKHFTLTINRRTDSIFEPFPLAFSQLDSIQLRSYAISDDLANFIVANENLRKISIPWTEPKRAVKLFKQLQNVNELNEIEYRVTPKAYATELIALMTDTGKYAKLQRVTVILSEQSDYGYFEDDIPKEWNIVENTTRFEVEPEILITFEHLRTSSAHSIVNGAVIRTVFVCLMISVYLFV